MTDFGKGLISYVCALIITVFVNSLMPGSIPMPNIILCLTVALIYIHDDNLVWMGFGLVAILIMDITSGLFIGIGFTSMLATELLVLLGKRFFASDNAVIALVCSVITTWIYYTLYWLLSKLKGSPYGYLYALKTIAALIIVNAVVFMIIYLILRKRMRKRNKRNWYLR